MARCFSRRSARPLKWYGGKQLHLKYLRPLIPPCSGFVEVFGGGATLLFDREPRGLEVYNDLDPELVHFMRVLKDEQLSPVLVEQLQRTPNSREEYARCNHGYELVTDPVERARRFFVLVRQSYNGVFRAGWSRPTRPSDVNVFANAVKRLPVASARLREVAIEQLDFRELIPKYDSVPDLVMYLDPPYEKTLRVVKNRYACEMSDEDHVDLARMLLELKSMVVLSVYAGGIYEEALKGWHRFEFPAKKHAARGRGKPKNHAPEVVWLNDRCFHAIHDVSALDKGWVTEQKMISKIDRKRDGIFVECANGGDIVQPMENAYMSGAFYMSSDPRENRSERLLRELIKQGYGIRLPRAGEIGLPVVTRDGRTIGGSALLIDSHERTGRPSLRAVMKKLEQLR